MILVTGANGNIGTEVVRQLAAKGQKVRAFVRDPEKAKKLGAPKVQLAKGDLGQPDTVRAALRGVDRLFLLSAGPDNIETNEPRVIDEARAATVKHVVKLSVFGAELESGIIGKVHRGVEKKIEDSGLAWTFIRPSAFMSNLLNSAAPIKAQGKFFGAFGEGKMPFIHPADVAAVAVKALTEPGHENKAYAITGPESLSQAQVAEKLSAATGKPVQYVDLTPEAAREGMIKAGLPPRLVDGLLQLTAAVRAGHAPAPTPELERLLDRKPRTFDEWAKENAAAFR